MPSMPHFIQSTEAVDAGEADGLLMLFANMPYLAVSQEKILHQLLQE